METINDVINKTINEIIDKYVTSYNKEEFFNVLKKAVDVVSSHQGDNYDVIVKELLKDYIEGVNAIAKLSPGLSTGLRDINNNVSVRTYVGHTNEGEDAPCINEDTVFDLSSMTKMFTAILMLNESEHTTFDLNKNFSYYSQLLERINVPVLQTMKFGNELRTDGRLDEKGLMGDEIARRLLNTRVVDTDTFVYSDVPYMLVPLLFDDSLKGASNEYLERFYRLFRDDLKLMHTGYTTKNMTGGIYVPVESDGILSYEPRGYYDPKATLLSKKLGLISGHAGAVSNVEDLDKLFASLSNNLLSKESLKTMITPVQDGGYLVDKDGNYVLKDGKRIIINKAMGVYINRGSVSKSLIPNGFADTAFASNGSSGTYALFDIENGLQMSRLSNIKSTTKDKVINTGSFHYGLGRDHITENYDTKVIGGTHTLDDGGLVREEGEIMRYVYANHTFNEIGRDTLLKLRVARELLWRINEGRVDASELYKNLFNSFNVTLKDEKKLVL